MASIALTISAAGPPVHFMAPVFFTAVVSFSGAMVIAECYNMMMDNFDISDLPEPALTPGSGSLSNSTTHQHRTQLPASLHRYDESFTTSHPCLSSGLAIFHGIAFLFAAMAVGVSASLEDAGLVRTGLAVYTALTCGMTVALVFALRRNTTARSAEVFSNGGRRGRDARVSLLQQSWGTRWTEVNGMEWWEDADQQAV